MNSAKLLLGLAVSLCVITGLAYTYLLLPNIRDCFDLRYALASDFTRLEIDVKLERLYRRLQAAQERMWWLEDKFGADMPNDRKQDYRVLQLEMQSIQLEIDRISGREGN